MNDDHLFMNALAYQFKDPSLLTQALTHPSLNAHNNQRLEFLGDAVLQLIISRRLYLKYPNLHEGMMTQLRQKLVCEHALAQAAEKIDLGAHLKMDKGCELSGGRTQESVVSDAMEAVLAAVYLDGGLDAAAKIIDRLWVDAPEQTTNAKNALQEYLQARGAETPEYVTLSESGPMHARVFTVAVLICGKEKARGTAQSKKKAEQDAAQKALDALKQQDGNQPCG